MPRAHSAAAAGRAAEAARVLEDVQWRQRTGTEPLTLGDPEYGAPRTIRAMVETEERQAPGGLEAEVVLRIFPPAPDPAPRPGDAILHGDGYVVVDRARTFRDGIMMVVGDSRVLPLP